jgi:uncharacterized membrane protein YgcG
MMHLLVGAAILLWIFHRSTSTPPIVQQPARSMLVATPARPESFWEDAGDTADNAELNLSYPVILSGGGGTGGFGGGGAGGGGGGTGGGGGRLR